MTKTGNRAQASLFTLNELSTRTGESAERLKEWQELGLVGAPGSDSFGPRDPVRDCRKPAQPGIGSGIWPPGLGSGVRPHGALLTGAEVAWPGCDPAHDHS